MKITSKMIEKRIAYLNTVTDSPLEPYKDGKPQGGNFSYEHWGRSLMLNRMHRQGGCKKIFSATGKAAFYELINVYIDGIELGKAQTVIHELVER